MPRRVGSRFQAEKRTWQSPEEGKSTETLGSPGHSEASMGEGPGHKTRQESGPGGLHLGLGLPSWLELLPPAKTCGCLGAVYGQRLKQENGGEGGSRPASPLAPRPSASCLRGLLNLG